MSEEPLSFDPIAEARRQWVAHGWDEAADGMAAITSVMRAEQIFLSRVEAVLKDFGLTFARYEALVLLMFSRAGSLPLNKMGERLQVHPTSVTNTIDRLEAQDLVRRMAHPTDRRVTLAKITEAGRARASKATDALNEHAFADPGLSPHELHTVFRLLRKLRVGAGDFTAPFRYRKPAGKGPVS